MPGLRLAALLKYRQKRDVIVGYKMVLMSKANVIGDFAGSSDTFCFIFCKNNKPSQYLFASGILNFGTYAIGKIYLARQYRFIIIEYYLKQSH